MDQRYLPKWVFTPRDVIPTVDAPREASQQPPEQPKDDSSRYEDADLTDSFDADAGLPSAASNSSSVASSRLRTAVRNFRNLARALITAPQSHAEADSGSDDPPRPAQQSALRDKVRQSSVR